MSAAVAGINLHCTRVCIGGAMTFYSVAMSLLGMNPQFKDANIQFESETLAEDWVATQLRTNKMLMAYQVRENRIVDDGHRYFVIVSTWFSKPAHC